EIASSVPLHQSTRGVVPEVAARAQIEAMWPILELALSNANCRWSDIDLIAVTEGPGLIGSLLVGLTTANAVAQLSGIPIVGVPHIWGHMYANLLDNDLKPQFPSLVLTVSGGHNDLYLWEDHGKFTRLGYTLDDAAGEAFDKCGRLMGLDYPAGISVSKLSQEGDPKAFHFPRVMQKQDSYLFSFSGLKTAFLYQLQKMTKAEIQLKQKDLCASLQEAIIESLWIKVKKAIQTFSVKEVYLSGGVSANPRLREFFQFKTQAMGLNLYYPANIKYCTDNAAMIAAAAYYCDFPLQKIVKLNMGY
ncbi:MAG TPA: tRNA (adenosine(37)-N6)-threonylcarbamoyltransferase complex transferase subunit TsaD, partial [Candidatus Gracilibacteria bacterium]|nr:tRNA (adenosine(37)-N6)-threonylcarbamoyltransferase complex transferase subunit TsaD [Candidatus Gracilibacteria bacterium]